MRLLLILINLVLVPLFLCASCYQKATVKELREGTGSLAGAAPGSRRFHITGPAQMLITLSPDKGFWAGNGKSADFTEEQLSKLRVKITSSDGALNVNGLIVDGGKTLLVDLRKAFDYQGQEGVVKDFGRCSPTLILNSYKNDSPDRLCGFILVVEDPQGVLRETGIRIDGGFQDSL